MKRLASAALAVMLAGLAVVLAWTVTRPVAPGRDVPALIAGSLDASGVSHPVTAVLLNFRGYDTLLELVVLLIALAGVRCLAPLPPPRGSAPVGGVLRELASLLLPVLVLVAVYLLWAGATRPGGAFQGGALLAAAGILALLAGRDRFLWRLEHLLWPLAGLGVAVFLAVAAGTLSAGGVLLGLPPAHAGTLILVIEGFALLSIAVTLVALFLGTGELEDREP
ncbi:MnhB domain-containing protein [Pseudohaliea sp.]|uniref:MnhB domain-containing protein n=1 Tax=Pseudohaliea sp. TaxID=2740289 RepID=UPI0032ECF0D9